MKAVLCDVASLHSCTIHPESHAALPTLQEFHRTNGVRIGLKKKKKIIIFLRFLVLRMHKIQACWSSQTQTQMLSSSPLVYMWEPEANDSYCSEQIFFRLGWGFTDSSCHNWYDRRCNPWVKREDTKAKGGNGSQWMSKANRENVESPILVNQLYVIIPVAGGWVGCLSDVGLHAETFQFFKMAAFKVIFFFSVVSNRHLATQSLEKLWEV